MAEHWYREAVVYCVEVDTFQDSNGDGIGDLPGLTGRLDYLAALGVTCLWLNPIHPTPHRDDGYDVADFYGVDSRLGTLGDFARFLREADGRGIRVIIDLVVNHTSNEHPWFRAACSDPASPYRGWYVWSETEPPDRRQGIVFPGEQKETWTFDDEAGAWYFHRFYDFQPDLNWSNPDVRNEIAKVMAFWLQLGVAGFRVDAAPFVLEQVAPGVDPAPKDFSILDDWRQATQWQRGDALLLFEANVPPGEVGAYFGSDADGPADRAHMLFSFQLNTKLWLALARSDAEPLVDALRTMPPVPRGAQWATFLRNHDELDLSTLTDEQRTDVFRAFAPGPEMRLYDRGIRRRLAPMLRGERRRIELAYALQFAMPGTPVVRYGEEIGMGDDLMLPGRASLRTPMQWDSEKNGGFSTADVLPVPVITRGAFATRKVNVRDEQRESGSLLRWFEQLVRAVRSCPEIGTAEATVLDVPLPRSVLAHRFDAADGGSVLLLHNLADRALSIDIGKLDGVRGRPWDVFADDRYDSPAPRLTGIGLNGWGYRWLRLS
ncbi:MAG: maltose alpha-D-glucosyltransferase / alpha-amylase [Pseudonocardiales bacterium]|nr:maltose alpha-D-glucosyltransferase / alpha-amylase [Pseudonocardiales bacterium]